MIERINKLCYHNRVEINKGGKEMAKNNKIDKSKLFVRIMAIILASLMVLSVAATLIFYLV